MVKRITLQVVILLIALIFPFLTLSVESKSNVICQTEACGGEYFSQRGWPIPFTRDASIAFTSNQIGELSLFESPDHFIVIAYIGDVIISIFVLNILLFLLSKKLHKKS